MIEKRALVAPSLSDAETLKLLFCQAFYFSVYSGSASECFGDEENPESDRKGSPFPRERVSSKNCPSYHAWYPASR